VQSDLPVRRFTVLPSPPIKAKGMSDAATGAERRTAPRYGCAGDAEIVLPGRGLRYAGRIGNLSVGGCFIEGHCDLERGTAVEVWMQADGQPLRAAANLMVRRTTGIGLRFVGMTERKTQQVRWLIAELAAEERRLRGNESENEGGAATAQEQPEMFSRHLHEVIATRRPNWLLRLARRLRPRKRRR
jgi:PilZ domain